MSSARVGLDNNGARWSQYNLDTILIIRKFLVHIYFTKLLILTKSQRTISYALFLPCVYVCACICICVYVWVYVYICVCVCADVCVSLYGGAIFCIITISLKLFFFQIKLNQFHSDTATCSSFLKVH